MQLGVDTLPELTQKIQAIATATSPFAFTGNRFEFAPSGSQTSSVAGPAGCENTILLMRSVFISRKWRRK